MSRGARVAAAVATLAVAWLGWSRLSGVAPEQASDSPVASRALTWAEPGALPPASALPGLPRRDLFRYGDAQRPAQRVPASAPAADATPGAPTAPPGPRLVGFVRQRERLRAAITVGGRVVLVAAGETVDGYVFLSVDEDRGVALRGPDGDERLLEPR